MPLEVFLIKIPSSAITPESVYLTRRKWMREILLFGAAALAGCVPTAKPLQPAPTVLPTTPDTDITPSTYSDLTNYNNFYEFSLEKTDVAALSKNFVTSPWQVEVSGLVNKPGIFDLDQIRKQFEQQERILRLRCVEGWSMVIPWVGFPLNRLLQAVEPRPEARYVRFTTLLDAKQFPSQKFSGFFTWPYQEGLRLDEAMHDLTFLATGLYGKPLPPQNGAPIRLVVPWKYGFKSIKSIVKIELVTDLPSSFWMQQAPDYYGFYANVNPDVPHPRWSQSTERRIGETARRKTVLFNGYADQVAGLYAGLDLKANF